MGWAEVLGCSWFAHQEMDQIKSKWIKVSQRQVFDVWFGILLMNKLKWQKTKQTDKLVLFLTISLYFVLTSLCCTRSNFTPDYYVRRGRWQIARKCFHLLQCRSIEGVHQSTWATGENKTYVTDKTRECCVTAWRRGV